MKLLYNPIDGEIFYTVKEVNLFWFRHTTNIPLAEVVIDEIEPNNKDICSDLLWVTGRTNVEGKGKYYINALSQLMEREGWVEYVPEEEV